MSKTAQRKHQAYAEGLRDAKNGFGFRWKRHPFMEQYKEGFDDGRRWFADQQKTILEKFREVFA
ncbi:hypothetical protein [Metapseudomonas otitidis]|uniref:hypothetical protein n=1 Tax=Metapseudomonas otitidis TaxID=319939 RepID=UPI002448321B|nr:hypothetical protein [Pseudomonas otitidis]MDG9780291.1 hypothetical protein [Pseudomonas otitidis]